MPDPRLTALGESCAASEAARARAENECSAMRTKLEAHSELRAGEELLIEKGRSADEHKKKRLDAKKELLSLVRELESERARTRRTIGDAGETLSRISVQVSASRLLPVTSIYANPSHNV